jgi:transcriptional regulator with XRE-family HTH domain
MKRNEKMPNKSTIAEKLIALMGAANANQRKLAEMLDTTPSHLSRILGGHVIPNTPFRALLDAKLAQYGVQYVPAAAPPADIGTLDADRIILHRRKRPPVELHFDAEFPGELTAALTAMATYDTAADRIDKTTARLISQAAVGGLNDDPPPWPTISTPEQAEPTPPAIPRPTDAQQP